MSSGDKDRIYEQEMATMCRGVHIPTHFFFIVGNMLLITVLNNFYEFICHKVV